MELLQLVYENLFILLYYMIIRIIKPYASIGLDIDVNVYVNFFKTFFPEYKILVSDTNVEIKEKDDIHIYISNTKYELTTKAKIRMFMINHELFFQKEEDLQVLRNIDIILCRTKIGMEWAEKIKKEHNLNYKTIYTKFTSLFKVIDIEKVYNLILHSAGQHHWKQTDTIVKTWKKYNDLPPIVITCTDQCYRNIAKILDNQIPKNMTLYTKLINEDIFIKLKNMSGIHLCPSIVEGYGHYINEARKVKSLVITTNYPPMNELIDENSGVLIDCSSFGKKKNGVTLCFINEDQLYEVIKKVYNMSHDQKIKLIEAAYKKFVEDTKYFNNSMKETFKNIELVGS
jgi:hypothetical protein